jgi:hypothetical protein
VVVLDLVLELGGDQPGRLGELRIEHLADLAARVETGGQRGCQPGGAARASGLFRIV